MAQSPHAALAEQDALAWLASLGCTDAELARAGRFDIAGYVGIPFPSLPRDKTVLMARYLALWLLWDDVHVESLENRWRISADHVRTGVRPEGMTRFDEGWWQLFRDFAQRRSPRWIHHLCRAMETWSAAAVDEAQAVRAHRERGVLPDLERQLELRIATIGMYATVYLLEDAYEYELPHAFHAHPTVLELKKLSSEIVGLGNDLLSFGKDQAEGKINLVSSLMEQHDLPGDEAMERVLRLHDSALEEYDHLAAPVVRHSPHHGPVIRRWLDDVRYASLGFSLWESRAPRYTEYRVVIDERVVEMGFDFFPAPRSGGRLDQARLQSRLS